MRITYAVFTLLLLTACADLDIQESQDDLGPGDARRAASQAVAGFDVAEGLEATLFAAEPLLVNPTNIDIDERGRVWVCEARNYRPDYNPHHPVDEAGDRILILEDMDSDGRADTRTVFYQGTDINAALGIMVMGNQAIVSASPNVFLLTDDDGDGKADRKEVLFTGIGGVQDDHGVHAFTFGPDGRFYFNFGNAGQQLLAPDGSPIVDLAGNEVNGSRHPYQQGMVFRTNLDRSGFEVLGHNFRNNYEVAVDAFGTLWQSDNDDDGNRGVRINYVMEYGNYGYRDEMTGEEWDAARTGMHPEIPKRHWHLNDPGVVPNLLQTGAGSPTGIAIYEGRLLPEMYWDQIIHADAGPNVVRSYPVASDGAGYSAEIVDLLKSRDDQWFRPSDVAVAPDGSLLVADWYDATVGGNQAVDQERGRIFRIAPPGTPYRIPAMDLTTPEGAVRALVSPNPATRYAAWIRLNAWQAEAEAALRDLWERSDYPRHRAQALWLLGRIEGRGAHYAGQALHADDPNLRIVGLRLARLLDLDLIPYIRQVVRDPSPQVRREAALALRHHDAPEAAGLWAELALQHDGQDRWYLEALGIGADRQWERFFAAWRDAVGPAWNTSAGRDIVWRARTPDALSMLADLIRSPDTDTAERLRYFRAFDFHDGAGKHGLLPALVDGDHPDQDQILILALKHLGDPAQAGTPAFDAALERALAVTAGTQAFLDLVDQFDVEGQSATLRRMAFGMPDSSFAVRAARLYLQQGGAEEAGALLQESDEAEELIALLGRVDTPQAHDLLEALILDEARDMTLRRRATSALGGNWNGEVRLLELAQSGELPEALKATAASHLLNVWRADLRKEAEQVFGVPPDAAAEPLPPIRSLAASMGNPEAGREVFVQTCSSCHQVQGQGVRFGPDLTVIGDKLSKHALFVAILHPDAGISFGYEGEHLTSANGSQAVGYVANETDDELELRLVGGQTQRFAKAEVTERRPLETSLMPALAPSMSREDLVDLVAYLHSLKQER